MALRLEPEPALLQTLQRQVRPAQQLVFRQQLRAGQREEPPEPLQSEEQLALPQLQVQLQAA